MVSRFTARPGLIWSGRFFAPKRQHGAPMNMAASIANRARFAIGKSPRAIAEENRRGQDGHPSIPPAQPCGGSTKARKARRSNRYLVAELRQTGVLAYLHNRA